MATQADRVTRNSRGIMVHRENESGKFEHGVETSSAHSNSFQRSNFLHFDPRWN
jgi:hypothetical protein